ncbi:hypothetical protein ACFY2N_06960, partial [Streptomyces rubiginosohelvolus]|uniref:hypothetical protein n=1 Tax=Streptomyces rubiginosohelvolus TaxID=67362 RepID=UPI0036C91B95
MADSMLADLTKKNIDVMTTAMRDEILVRAPAYADLETVHKVDLLGEAHHSLILGTQYILLGEPLPECELDFFRDVGRQRATANSPLSELRATYDAAYVGGLRKLFSITDFTHYPDLRAFLEIGSQEVARMLRASETGWAEARARLGGRGEVREVLVKQLLEGGPVTAAAEAAQVVLPAGYVVLLCQLRHPVVQEARASAQAGVRAVESIPGALWRGDPSRGNLLVLLPAREDPGMAR